jgi:hypothetical protein
MYLKKEKNATNSVVFFISLFVDRDFKMIII